MTWIARSGIATGARSARSCAGASSAGCSGSASGSTAASSSTAAPRPASRRSAEMPQQSVCGTTAGSSGPADQEGSRVSGKKIDRAGQVFGALTVVAHSHSVYRSPRHGSYQFWRCRCSCGAETVVPANNLTNGNTTSCGCRGSRRTLGERATRHGMSDTPTFKSWQAMLDRCRYPSHVSWKWYGAKGVVVCERWHQFENFVADMGARPSGASIDRIDPSGNYEPSNCRWADAKTQASNKRGAQ